MKLLHCFAAVLLLIATLLVLPAAAGEQAAKPLVIDVRTDAEWQSEHLEGALHIPYETIGTGIAKVAPDRKTKIMLYCRTGRRSGIALDTLQKSGYDDVTNLGSVQEASDKLHIPIIRGDR
jgi:phage shock protein E